MKKDKLDAPIDIGVGVAASSTGRALCAGSPSEFLHAHHKLAERTMRTIRKAEGTYKIFA